MAAALRQLAAGFALLPALATAQALADPTLPPPRPAEDKAAAGREAALRVPLQFTLRGSDDVVRAYVAGRWVRAGDALSVDGVELRVEQVTESSVVLLRGDERQVIEMAPQARQAVRLRESENRRSSR
jgi:hypothetical protein